MKYCSKCENQMQDDMSFCPKCGTSQEQASPPTESKVNSSQVVNKTNSQSQPISSPNILPMIAIAMGILGIIIAKLTDSFGLGEILVIAGIICSIISKKIYAIAVTGLCVWFTITLWFIGW